MPYLGADKCAPAVWSETLCIDLKYVGMDMKHPLFLMLGCALLGACTVEPDATVSVNSDEAAYRSGGPQAVEGWIRIKLSDDGSSQLRTGAFTRGEFESGDERIDAVARELGATEIRRVFADGGRFAERRRRYGLHLWYDIRFDETVPVTRAGEAFAATEGIEYCEPIYGIALADVTEFVPADAVYVPSAAAAVGEEGLPFDDPMLASQWHYHNDGSVKGAVAGSDINLFEAWKTETGNPDVIVAVMDSGVQWDHPDLAANMWVNEQELNGAARTDNDGNGYKNDVYGYNFVTGSGAIHPEMHGTHVAGTVSAVNNNGIGVCGVAGGSGLGDGVRIMGCQVIQGEFSVPMYDADCYVYAADNGAVISQNSWSWGGLSALPGAFATAFDYFIDNAGMDDTDGDGVNDTQTGPMRGGIIICAAGNIGSEVQFPAADSRTIAVGAVGVDYSLQDYSCRGPEVDIVAPGGVAAGPADKQVFSTVLTSSGSYVTTYGTSMACPHVSGVAALIVSHYGGEGFTADECRQRLLRAYRPLGGRVGNGDLVNMGVGLLDAAAAFVSDPGTAPGEAGQLDYTVSGSTVTLFWTAPVDGNGNAVTHYDITFTPTDGGDPIVLPVANYHEGGSRLSLDVQCKYSTDYKVEIVVVDRYGNSSAGATLDVSVGAFVNRPPVRSDKKLSDRTITGFTDNHAVRIRMAEYFSDPDAARGDVLAYTCELSDPTVVSYAFEDDYLVIRPLKNGRTDVLVKATDLAGESVAVSFAVTVAGPGSDDGLALTFDKETGILRIAAGAGVVSVYDSAARRVMRVDVEPSVGGAELNVSALAPGRYSVVLDSGNEVSKGVFLKQ